MPLRRVDHEPGDGAAAVAVPGADVAVESYIGSSARVQATRTGEAVRLDGFERAVDAMQEDSARGATFDTEHRVGGTVLMCAGDNLGAAVAVP